MGNDKHEYISGVFIGVLLAYALIIGSAFGYFTAIL